MLPSPVSVAVSSEEIVPSVPGPMPPDSPDAKHRMLGGRGSALNILIGVDMEALVKKELAKISTWNFNVLEGHTGYSNNFHINTNDHLAIRYAYRSPLENMHCAVAFELLHSRECDILATLSDVERIEVALHAADVSNPVKPWAVYQTWTDRIMTEFYAQGDHERRLALPMSFGCDRHNPIPQAKMQAGFILGIVRPVFHTLSRVPKVHLKHCLDQLDRNLKVWQDQLAPTA
ncbi:hypothetical protein DYB25_008567 [Aphanomyces astaci]|uniref:PDEase domain-containing protein n=2 Tax=Aphanomyces astaci TaxID=112090 RepID=A0A397B670_APHAT|nr:hypothetical protein DYB25_008567 [Aphanomyces astaci]RHY53147.1 hypothetical protein DYB34_004703 [Aphanomyces astaci]